ncbi:MAG: hypothetical protein JJU34_02250 [Lunatimonas sp.]|uniref:DUF6134 family protein n=1 Tax=Lunatimonas sp. TaxID=2060141 RepID=UPI00263AA47A|nr:DUF6134 family protein [Lunatimonas sp.]MCC5936080.1 hypothetical protein [Lunatimonas sp.]
MSANIYRVFLFLIFQVFLFSASSAQEVHRYDITVAGFTIGEMEAKKWDARDTTYFQLTSKVSFWLFGQINIDYLTEVNYFGERFISSRVESTTNRGDFLSRVWLDGEVYQVDAKSYKYELRDEISEEVTYSAVRLFFEEPRETDRMLAENYGVFGEVFRVDKGGYESLANGNKNRYEYTEGKLQRAVMQSPIKNYVIKRR